MLALSKTGPVARGRMVCRKQAGVMDTNTLIGHVLFMDIVAFTQRDEATKQRLIGALKHAVRASAVYQNALAQNTVLDSFTGDGMALIFLEDETAPLRCALDIARSLPSDHDLPLRYGVHSGAIKPETSVGGIPNYIGVGIDRAQRVMDCALPGQILVARDTVDQSPAYTQFGAHLHDLGERKIKYGNWIALYGYHDGAIGQPSVLESEPLETPSGAVPLESKFYIERPCDETLRRHLTHASSIVVLYGARQMGKTSLLARGMEQARERNATLLFTDLQAFERTAFESPKAFYLAVMEDMARQLRLKVDWETVWSERSRPNFNFEQFFLEEILDKAEGALVWGIDEADRLFHVDFGQDVFALLRTWHNNRANRPREKWRQLTLLLACATDASCFLPDDNQSPFNVGERILLSDFTREQVAELNHRYQSPLKSDAEIETLRRLTNGHPYLIRRGLHEMRATLLPLVRLVETAASDAGPYGDHLRRLLTLLQREPELKQTVQSMLRGSKCPEERLFYRLRSIGILDGINGLNAHLRCPLYRDYFACHLV